MRVLVIDDEPRWGKFCLELGYTVKKSIELEELKNTNFDVYIVSDRQPLVLFEVLKSLGKRFIIATSQPIARGAISAYRLSAACYIAKDFREEVIREKVEKVVY